MRGGPSRPPSKRWRPSLSQFGPTRRLAHGGIAYLWLVVLGYPGRSLASVLGVHPAVVYQAARQGVMAAATWQPLLGKDRKAT